MGDLFRELAGTARSLARRPGFTLVVVLTLALGIGANAAIFSVVDAVLLEPLPYAEPERLVRVYTAFPGMGFDTFWMSEPEYLELGRWSEELASVGAYRQQHVNVVGPGSGDRPLRAQAAYATAGLFETLGVPAERGRVYGEAEDRPGAPDVTVLSWELWQGAFGGDPEIVGRRLRIDGEPHTVLGVMPEGFDVDDSGVELWLPVAIDLSEPGGRASHYLNVVARLAPGASIGSARAELDNLMRRWEEEFDDTHHPDPEHHPFLYEPLREDLVGDVRPAVLLLLGAVGLVLLVACANVANLLLARAEARQKEVAVRSALGASRRRLLAQALGESLLLALAGGAAGLGLAWAGLELVLATYPEAIPRVSEVGLDARVLGFTLVVSILTGLLFGLAPVVFGRVGSAFDSLRQGGRSTSHGRHHLRRGLVVAEVALSALLVLGAGLLMRSFWNLTRVDPGFDAQGVLAFQLEAPSAEYPEGSDVEGFYARLEERLAALPGAVSAATMTGLPPVRDLNANDTQFESVPRVEGGPPHNVDYYQTVTPAYFETLGIPVVEGRPFEAAEGAPVVLVNETMARTFWPERSPVGDRVRPCCGDGIPWFTVVGVVDDVKQGGIAEETGTELYFLAPQTSAAGQPQRTRWAVVRTEGDPMALAGSVREVVRELDPSLPVAHLQPLGDAVSGALARSRFLTLLIGLFAFVALALAAVGTYAVLSWAIEERRREMGVRMALGAQQRTVLGLVLGGGMAMAGAGLAIGLVGALALRRVLSAQLYGVGPWDPATFAAVAVLLVAVAFLACLVPAWRATRVDPVVALRGE